MTAELTVLALAALLQVAQLGLAGLLKDRQLGATYNLSARDAPAAPLTGYAGRAERALRNHYESLPIFAIAVLVLVYTDKTMGLTTWLAWTYLGARLLYVPAYLYALSPWRSVIWFVGFLSMLALLVIALV